MRFKKIVFIRYIPLTAKVYQDFYMKEALLAGLGVEYWDISAIFFKHTADQEDSSSLTHTRKINSYIELEAALNAHSKTDTLFVSIMTFEGRVGKLYHLFTKYNCTIAVFGRNMFPLQATNGSSLLQRLSRITPSKLINYINTLIVKQQKLKGKIKEYDIIFTAGNQGWQGVGSIKADELSRAEIVKVNSNDYDKFLLLKKMEPLIVDDYILFLDEYLPLHPDTTLFGIKNISPEDYYPELCRYFDRVELQFGMPVVIAAHPKAIRYREENFFANRKVFFGKSAELSKSAHFVLAHDSTSINFPINFHKKLHFITSKNIERDINSVHRQVIHFANYLGCNYQYFDVDEPINLIDIIPEAQYEKYKYEYQTNPDTENKLSSEIFIEFLTRS